MNDTGMDCTTCGMRVVPANAYHPFLYCELRKLGHLDPEAHLRSYGFARPPERTPVYKIVPGDRVRGVGDVAEGTVIDAALSSQLQLLSLVKWDDDEALTWIAAEKLELA